MNVMLLAAGEGTRLRPYTYVQPKPAIPFLNIPLAAYPLAFLEDVRIQNLVVNTFHLPTKVVDLFVPLNHGAKKLHFSHEIARILGNGGGLGFARSFFRGQGDLILMNSDEVILPQEKHHVAKALEFHKSTGALCTLITMDHPGVGSQFGGVWLNDDDEVKGFGKVAPSSECRRAEHFIGVQILSEEIFNYLPEEDVSNILYDGVAKGIAEGKRVQRYKIDCHWFETGNIKDYLKATAECLHLLGQEGPVSSIPREHLAAAISRFSGEAPAVVKHEHGIVLKHSTATIDPSVSLSGFAVLGAGAVVGKNSQLKNVVVGAGTELSQDTHAENELFL